MRTSDFDYSLPQELIAQTPVEPRDNSSLMVLCRGGGDIEHRRFHEIGEYLGPGDVLVLNKSRVIPARLVGRRRSGGKVEVLLLRRLEPCLWEALVRPSNRVGVGEAITLAGGSALDWAAPQSREVQVLERREEGVRTVRFADESLLQALGQVPLPPYIRASLEDPERYQTVYGRENGSVAAPTAGLHFTTKLLERLCSDGIGLAFVTLHVGLDTFRPVRVEDPWQHHIHSEYGEIDAAAVEVLASAKARGNRVICVGTTTVRLIEQAALASRESGTLRPFKGPADLFILPGHHFRYTDCLVTNFHLPRTTLLMMVCAFAGRELIDRAYREAIAAGYRFYSFGDAMLIL